MMKRTALSTILLLGLITALSVNAFAASGVDYSNVSAGPGVFVMPQGSLSPRIDSIPVDDEEPFELETIAEEETVTEAGTELKNEATEPEGNTVETVLLPDQAALEEKIAADLLLTEQRTPKTKELYHSSKYLSSSATLTINNEGDGDTYIKFYSPKSELVFAAYVRAGEKLKVQIPGGYYKMRQAFGEKWYGTKDMFGNCGRYCECAIGDTRLFNIKRSGSYVISTQGQGDAFSKIEVPMESF